MDPHTTGAGRESQTKKGPAIDRLDAFAAHDDDFFGCLVVTHNLLSVVQIKTPAPRRAAETLE